jgi:hypothetical protein
MNHRWLASMLAALALTLTACGGDVAASTPPPPSAAWRGSMKVMHQGVGVDVVIDKPQGDAFDVLVVYHGTVMRDDRVMKAAQETLDRFRRLIDDPSMMVVSVAYPGENLLLGDNLAHAEAALLWVRDRAASELGVRVRHVFLGGHSQGGYLVTRLNTLHPTRGVIANAPGPIDLVYRCGLEADGRIAAGEHCRRLRDAFGSPHAHPEAYLARSLRSFATGYLSDVLFVQGLADRGVVHMASWPGFRQQVRACTNCRGVEVLELPGFGHSALFDSDRARDAVRAFLDARR